MSDEEKQAPEVVQEAGEEKTDEGATEEASAESANKYFNHTYIRSIEGILRLITIPLAIVFFVINIADYRTGGEWFNICVAIGWIIYAVITIIIEVVVPEVFVHRFVDGIVCIVYAVFWGLAVLVAIIDAARFEAVGIGISVIFGVAVTALIGVNAFFALRTWRTYEEGKKGSVAIFVI